MTPATVFWIGVGIGLFFGISIGVWIMCILRLSGRGG